MEGDVTCLPNFMDIVKEVLVSAKQLFLALIKGPSCIVGVGVRKVSASVDHSRRIYRLRHQLRMPRPKIPSGMMNSDNIMMLFCCAAVSVRRRSSLQESTARMKRKFGIRRPGSGGSRSDSMRNPAPSRARE